MSNQTFWLYHSFIDSIFERLNILFHFFLRFNKWKNLMWFVGFLWIYASYTKKLSINGTIKTVRSIVFETTLYLSWRFWYLVLNFYRLFYYFCKFLVYHFYTFIFHFFQCLLNPFLCLFCTLDNVKWGFWIIFLLWWNFRFI